MPNYENGKIYKLTSTNTDQIYIGSTTITLYMRFAIHKSQYKKLITCSSKKLFELGEDDVKIELIKNFPTTNSIELKKEEMRIMKEYDNTVNINRPYKSKEESKRERCVYASEYRKKNVEKNNKEKLAYYYKTKEKCQIRFKKYYLKKKAIKMKAFEQRMDDFIELIKEWKPYKMPNNLISFIEDDGLIEKGINYYDISDLNNGEELYIKITNINI